MASYMAPVKAFFFSGRVNRMSWTSSSSVISISFAMERWPPR